MQWTCVVWWPSLPLTYRWPPTYVKSLQLIGKSGTHRPSFRVLDIQMSRIDVTKWQETSQVAPVIATSTPPQYKDRRSMYGDSHFKMRRLPHGLIFNMVIYVMARRHLYTDTVPHFDLPYRREWRASIDRCKTIEYDHLHIFTIYEICLALKLLFLI